MHLKRPLRVATVSTKACTTRPVKQQAVKKRGRVDRCVVFVRGHRVDRLRADERHRFESLVMV